MNGNQERNDLQEIIDKAVSEMMAEDGKVNLARLGRQTGLSRAKLRRIEAAGFVVAPHGNSGKRRDATVLSGFTGVLDSLLQKGVTNSSVCFERLREAGYTGGLTTVKNYMRQHADLVPARRKLAEASPQGSRGQRFQTGPGEAYQMDWGFVNVDGWAGETYRIACFCMVCHHCGTCYIEFFPNARQENLFIGMVHAFLLMGVPGHVLTDNMRSVVLRRDLDGRPVWQADYEAFMRCVGFKTRLCKPRHPFTKGKVERLVRFVKENFLAGRAFTDITQLNAEALSWCGSQSGRYRRALGCVPAEEHAALCAPAASAVDLGDDVAAYLCPRRKVSFDGFVCYEGRRFGVPLWYTGGHCRVSRDGSWLHVYSDDLSRELAAHPVTWSRGDSFCEGQYSDAQPCELPSVPVKVAVPQLEPPSGGVLGKFDFEGRL